MTITADQLAILVSEALEARGLQLVTNDELAALESARAELAALRAELDEERRADYAPSSHGCMDNSCVIAKPTGMATNGGCRCGRAALKSALWRAREERDAARAEGAASEREACAARLEESTRLLDGLAAECIAGSESRRIYETQAETLRAAIDVIRERSNGGAR